MLFLFLHTADIDVRMAQYESGTRTPKEKLIADLVNALEVTPKALDVPEIDNYVGLMHTLFALGDLYGLKINSIDGELCLTLDKTKGITYLSMLDMFSAWQRESEKLKKRRNHQRRIRCLALRLSAH
jgi:hypothetical protein